MVVEELYHAKRFEFLAPEISWHVDHCAEELEQKVRMLVRRVRQFYVSIHELFKRFERIRIKLGNIAAHFKEKSVTVLEGPDDELLVLVVLRHDLSVTRVSSEVDSQGNELLAHDWLGAMND